MDDQLISHIEELGLSNKEARIYIAALKLGPSGVQQIADQSGIKRVTTYVILESLGGLGLISQSLRGKKTYFVAESPTNLKRLLQKRQQELDEQNHYFDQILPQLESLKTLPKELPEVKLYEGAEAVKTLFESMFANYRGPSKTIYSISNLDEVNRLLPKVGIGNPNPYRIKYNVKSHLIYTTKRGPIYRDTDKDFNRTSRYLPADKFPVTGEVNVLDEYVVMMTFKGAAPVGVAIHNRDLADSYLNIFNLCWETAKAFNPPPED